MKRNDLCITYTKSQAMYLDQLSEPFVEGPFSLSPRGVSVSSNNYIYKVAQVRFFRKTYALFLVRVTRLSPKSADWLLLLTANATDLPQDPLAFSSYCESALEGHSSVFYISIKVLTFANRFAPVSL